MQRIKLLILLVLLFAVFKGGEQQDIQAYSGHVTSLKVKPFVLRNSQLILSSNQTINTTIVSESITPRPVPTPTPTPIPTPTLISAPVDTRTPVQIGQAMASQRGWVGEQWASLYNLWQKESGWNPLSYNTDSGACNIPQALPCSKIADHSVSGQIEWGLAYISERYGTPSNAWYHELLYGWY